MTLGDHIRSESARLAALCTACGGCVRACPMTDRVPGLGEGDEPAIAAGMRDVLLDGPGTPAALAWIAACTRSGLCTAACPEGLDAAFMLRLAAWRAKGALGGAPLIAVKEDPQFSAKAKAFARLTMTEQEQAEWL